MAKNRRSGNRNSEDTVELLERESALLISDPIMSGGNEKPQRAARSSKSSVEATVELADTSKKNARRTKQEGGSSSAAGKSAKQAKSAKPVFDNSGAAAGNGGKRGQKVKQDVEQPGKADKSVKRVRGAKPDTEKSAELTETAPKRRSRKANVDSEKSKNDVSDKLKKSSAKNKHISERAAAEIIEDKPKTSVRKSSDDFDETVESVPKKRVRKPKPAEEADMSAEEKASEQDDNTGLGGCKTRQVMKLIEGDSENLVVFAGKSRVPNLLRGRESLSAMMRRNTAGMPEYDDTEVVNITELVIRYEAAGILDRFNACSCEKCVNAFSKIIAEKIPVRYARISKAELNSGVLPERAVPMRQIVLPEMIRQLICNKKRCFHDE